MKNSHVKSGFVLSYVSIGVQSVISIVYTPVMLRLLGQSDYGLLQIAMSAIAHLGILSFGFSGSYLRFYSSSRARVAKRHVRGDIYSRVAYRASGGFYRNGVLRPYILRVDERCRDGTFKAAARNYDGKPRAFVPVQRV